jgi:hypothetical protein
MVSRTVNELSREKIPSNLHSIDRVEIVDEIEVTRRHILESSRIDIIMYSLPKKHRKPGRAVETARAPKRPRIFLSRVHFLSVC